ncbi:hypothetical protein BO71DRAFT_467628 [Aspergillus ellipticus CBS 707.79]|uniref:DAPG hydrolase PhiG domain-containing protein n=1 Tax=Aspergillus ellipticus CBS 707.79 TaxID=1448320 RepID=A0A319CUZ0_9EURO|nr:hypothetical protein BO71DRAFT_467628 [Aspergillus ellipticus CBS 707.79]
MSESKISRSVDSYDPDESKLYLGYKDKDFEKPYAKYFNPNVELISDEVHKGLICSPWASGLGYEAHDAHDHLLRPGYLAIENGFVKTKNGTMMVAVRTNMGQVTGEAYDWWFSWHSTDSSRYKLWHPHAHQYSWRHPDTLEVSNKSYAERYINTFSFINEYIGNHSAQLTVAFIDPAELGINKEKWPALGIETMVCAKISGPGGLLIICSEQGHITEGFDGVSYLIHQIRRRPDGARELRSRFWLAKADDGAARGLMVHCAMEMSHLAKFLPQLFAEFKEDV